jgi:creatinine amidohydrolase
MHAGELETSILLAYAPEIIRLGNETADWTSERPQMLTLGMAGYTKSGVIGRPSLGTAEKGAAVMASLTRSLRRSTRFSWRLPEAAALRSCRVS